MTDQLTTLQHHLRDKYQIIRPIGAGGMATVYLATDKHDRQVAIKVLLPQWTAALGASRFLQEIRVTAHFQHPHILPLYDSGTAGDLLYYVMPFVAGESLRTKLERERLLPVDEAIHILKTVAGALDYAHRQGVIHRDIKPENILISDGQPLVADFGIALAVSAASDRITQTGLSVGTPQYMSPEQGAGEVVDKRSDIYSLACVGYEMLAGGPPHRGANAQGILASVLTTPPQPLTELRPTTPLSVATTIHRALERFPADRFGTATDFAEALTKPREPTISGRSSPWWWVGLAATLVIGIVLGQVSGGRKAQDVRQAPVRRFNLTLPERSPLALAGPGPLSGWQTALALSPDGEWLTYVAAVGGDTRLMIRRMDSDSITPVPGTEGAYHPFFSPDGRWIGFLSGNEIKKIQLGGVSPLVLGRVNRPVGATWGTNDRILLFENDGFALRWVAASGGGQDSSVTLATQFGTPELLPGEQWAVGQLSSGQLALLSLTDGHQSAITARGIIPLDSVGPADLLIGSSPKWVPASRHLVFATGDGVLAALPFDGDRRVVLGPPAPVLSGVRVEEAFAYGEYALGRDGTLIYVPGAHQNWGRIAFINPNGTFDTLAFPRGRYTQLRISPSGHELATQEFTSGTWQVSILDLVSGQRRRFPIEGWVRAFPGSWSPDGTQLLIGVWSPVQYLNLGAILVPVSGGPGRKIDISGASYMSIAPNGTDIVYSDWRTGDLFVRSLWDTTRTAIPAQGFAASFSPDGRWLAWGDVNGGVMVSPIPPTGAIYAVAERGQQALWSPRGDRLIYRDGRRFLEVDVSTSGGFRTGPPRQIAAGPFVQTFAWNHSIGPDGRLAAVVALGEQTTRDLRVVTGFPIELGRVAPPTQR